LRSGDSCSTRHMRGVWHTCESRKGDPAASGLALATTYQTASVMSLKLEHVSPKLNRWGSMGFTGRSG
jgi:hypothetical protein